MAWNNLTNNQAVSGLNLTDAVNVNTLYLKNGQTITNSTKCYTRSQAMAALHIYPISNDNKLVKKSELINRPTGWRGSSPTCVIEPETTLTEFDYLIIRYKWALGAGRDLDTFTGYVNTGTVLDNKFLGFGLGNGNSIPTTNDASLAYIMWAGDNTTDSGVEGVLFNLSKMCTDYPTLNTIPIRMACAWYSSRASGNIDIQVTTYLGGVMSKVGFDYVNTGGTLVQDLTFSKNIPRPPAWSNNIDNAVPVGFVTYYRTGKTGTIVIDY